VEASLGTVRSQSLVLVPLQTCNCPVLRTVLWVLLQCPTLWPGHQPHRAGRVAESFTAGKEGSNGPDLLPGTFRPGGRGRRNLLGSVAWHAAPSGPANEGKGSEQRTRSAPEGGCSPRKMASVTLTASRGVGGRGPRRVPVTPPQHSSCCRTGGGDPHFFGACACEQTALGASGGPRSPAEAAPRSTRPSPARPRSSLQRLCHRAAAAPPPGRGGGGEREVGPAPASGGTAQAGGVAHARRRDAQSRRCADLCEPSAPAPLGPGWRRSPAMADPRLRQIKIKTGVVRR